MKYRKLRIAWSAFFGILCLLLIVLWVRTCSVIDTIKPFAHDEIFIITEPGAVGIAAMPAGYGAFWSSDSTSEWIKGREGDGKNYSPLVGNFEVSPVGVILPFWVVILSLAIFCGLPWMHWSNRFSLRTLLIATTLVAVVLGIIAISI